MKFKTHLNFFFNNFKLQNYLNYLNYIKTKFLVYSFSFSHFNSCLLSPKQSIQNYVTELKD